MQSNRYKPHYKNVPQSWVICKLADVCYVESGYAFSSDDYSRSGTPLVRISNIIDSQISLESCVYINSECDKRFHVKKGDLLIAMSGATTGKMGVYDSNETAFLNQRVGNIKVINENVLLNDYRNIFMYSQIGNILELAYGGAQPNISANIICSLPIPIPSIKEQKRIIMAVGKWFSLIDTLETAKEDLQTSIEYTKSKILDLAIHGKLVPQDPNDEPAIELLSRINPRFTPCDNAHCPYDIPGNWYWSRLIDLCSFLSRGKSPTYSEERKYPVFAQKCNLYGGGISLGQARFLDPNTLSKWPEEYKLRDGDVLVNSTGTGTVGRTRLFHSECLGNYPFVVPDSHVSVVRMVESIDSDYIYSIVSSKYGQEYLEDNLAGSTNQKELYIGVLENMLIPLPPYDEQRRIANKIEELFAILDTVQDSIEA